MKKIIVFLFLALGFTAFSQDSTTTFSYNYRKGMQHYNKGVDIINAIHPEQTLQVDSLSPQAKTEFNLAIPLLYKAYKMKPTDENVLKALQGSYFSLSDFEKANKYKKELEALKK